MDRRLFAVAVLTLTGACYEPATAPGGADRRFEYHGTIGNTGYIAPIPLPDRNQLPVMTCYISPDAENWLPVAQTTMQPGVPSCIITGLTTPLSNIVLGNAPSGWHYHIILLY